MKFEYNATVISNIMVTLDIMVLRVNTDTSRAEFESRQYTVLGLYNYTKHSRKAPALCMLKNSKC
jgi:hypothetical protein